MRLLTFTLPLFILLLGCGNPEPDNNQEIETVDIIGIDQMKYVVEQNTDLTGTAENIEHSNGNTYLRLENITVSPGQQLRIRLTALSQLPANAMAHNWILLNRGVDPSAFSQDAIKAKADNYIPQGRSGDIVAHTSLATGGNTVEVTFTVPEQTGQYDFLCSFPGHFTGGMTGKLIVE